MVARKTDRDRRIGRQLRLRDLHVLQALAWILAPGKNVARSLVEDAFRAEGLTPPRPLVTTYSMQLRVQLLSTGHYLTVFTDTTVQRRTLVLESSADRAWSPAPGRRGHAQTPNSHTFGTSLPRGGASCDANHAIVGRTCMICSVLALLRHHEATSSCPLPGVKRCAPGDRQGVDGASPSR